MSKKLFNDDSDSNEETIELKTNVEYAKSYNKFREKELLKKLKDREKDDDSDSSSEAESSDEENLAINPKFDVEFFRTLASLKSKDPKIYDKNVTFFEADIFPEKNIDGEGTSKSSKAMTVKDFERKVILEKGGVYEDDESEDGEVERPQSPSYVQEQKALRDEIKNALNKNDSEDEEFGGIFKKRVKTKKEEDNEEKDYLTWLAGQSENEEKAPKELKPLKEYWSNPKLPREEQFLRDYILNNGYENNYSGEIPTYDEIVGNENLSDDEQELEKQAEFEHKYNFRFEEPDKEFIKRYPRTVESSVRRVDDRRKEKRVEMRDRKKQEKEQKFQELEMLKEIKKKEIEEKIRKLKEVTGNEELPFKDDELEDDFDPEAHDRRMREVFDDGFYAVDEGEEKPECPDIEDLKTEDWDNYDPNRGDDYEGEDAAPHCEDEDFNMDCEYDADSKANFQEELIDSTRDKRKKRNRRNRFMEMIRKEKPAFDPEDQKTYADYIDEYYKMDCEDIIGDIPCRFKYVETEPNDFGLTIEEILLAKNKELNQWASLKKAVQIRPTQLDRHEAKMYRLKAQNMVLKRKIFRSLYGSSSEDEGDEEDKPGKAENAEEKEPQKNKRKKKNKKRKLQENGQSQEVSEVKKPKLDMNNSSPDGKSANTKKEITVNKKLNLDAENSTNIKSENKAIQEVDNNQALRVTDKKKKNKKNKKSLDSSANQSISNVANTNEDSKPPKPQISPKNRQEQNKFTKNHKTLQNNQKDLETGKKNPFSNKTKGGFKKNPFKKSGNDGLSDERLKAYGINPKKYNKKQIFMKRNNKIQSSGNKPKHKFKGRN